MHLDYKATIWCRIPIQNKKAKQQVIDLINAGYLPAELYNILDTEVDIGRCELLYETEEFLTPKENDGHTIELWENNECTLVNEKGCSALIHPDYKIL